jgi:NAD(P)-dependent dehydrogenase (short-subunit alcohol dehydrogenase family)
MMQADALADRVVLVTGAAGEIGSVVACRVVESGGRVVLADLPAPDEKRVLELLGRLGDRASYVRCDVTRGDDVDRAVRHACDRFGQLDGAANVAGIVGPAERTVEYPEDLWRRVVDVNLLGTWLCMRSEIAAMLRAGHGAIVNIASVAGHTGEVNRSAYVASKAGVVGLTRVAAVEYAAHGIRVNAISPGPIDTIMMHEGIAGRGTERYDAVIRALPIGRYGQPAEVAEAVVWLLSPASSFVVGHELMVDGGITAEGLWPARLVPV